MAAIVPTRMIGIQPHSLIVGVDGTVREVGPWTLLAIDADECKRMIDGVERNVRPDDIAALIVPSTQDAIMNLINAGFQIKSAEVIDS